MRHVKEYIKLNYMNFQIKGVKKNERTDSCRGISISPHTSKKGDGGMSARVETNLRQTYKIPK